MNPGNPNKGKSLRKTHFTKEEVEMIRLELKKRSAPDTEVGKKAIRDLVLFNIGIDSCLRSNDLVEITLEDVKRKVIVKKVNKTEVTKNGTTIPPRFARFKLREGTKESLKTYLEVFPVTDRLFLDIRTLKPIKSRTVSKLVKDWAEMIYLDPKDYGAHTLRKTYPANRYLGAKKGIDREVCLMQLMTNLVQKNKDSLIRYLGIDEQEAMDEMHQFDL